MITLRRVHGSSMEPSYKKGQIIVFTPLKKPQVGDVVVAIQNKREVLKRVAAIRGGHMLELRGDNIAASTDSRTHGPVSMNAVLGVVIWPKRPLL